MVSKTIKVCICTHIKKKNNNMLVYNWNDNMNCVCIHTSIKMLKEQKPKNNKTEIKACKTKTMNWFLYKPKQKTNKKKCTETTCRQYRAKFGLPYSRNRAWEFAVSTVLRGTVILGQEEYKTEMKRQPLLREKPRKKEALERKHRERESGRESSVDSWTHREIKRRGKSGRDRDR